MNKPTSLVTGCAGFVGSHVAEELLRMGHRVVGLDDLSGGFHDNVPDGVDFHAGSITDAQLVDDLFNSYRFDYVFHLAAYAAEGLSHFIRHFNYTNNLLGSVNLINASVNTGSVRCFVFTSSMAVYGSNQVPMSEEMTPMPEDPYGVAKYGVEMDLKHAHEMFGLDYIIFRPHNVYGERQNIGDRYRNVIGIFMNQVMRGEPMTVFGDGLQTRAFSYISDVAPVIARSIERPAAYNGLFNVGGEVPCTILEMAQEVARAMKCPASVRHLEPRYEVKHAFTTHDRVKQIFGDLMNDVPLSEGIDRMARWAQRTGPRDPSRYGRFEIEKNLYSFWQEQSRSESRKAA